jgi:hypothetical protein
MLFQEPCARTVPRSVLEAVSFVKERGGILKNDRMIESEELANLVADMTLKLSTTAPLTRKAPLLLVSVAIALELYVVDELRPKYKRAFAWTKLLRLWASMRGDDIQGLLPETMILQRRGLEAVLDRTKTSGPGRKIRWLNVFVSSEAYIVKPDWLKVGHELWSSEDMNFKRDYLLPVPDSTMESVGDKRAEYADMAIMSQLLFGELGAPHYSYKSEEWSLMDSQPLLGNHGAKFYTEHSERNFVNSHAAVLGFSKTKRDYLGRWQPQQSDDYLRTAREVVNQIQRQVAQAIRAGDSRISEETPMTALEDVLKDFYDDEDLEDMMNKLDYRNYVKKGLDRITAEDGEEDKVETAGSDRSNHETPKFSFSYRAGWPSNLIRTRMKQPNLGFGILRISLGMHMWADP